MEQQLGIQQVVGPAAQGAAQPGAKRYGEACLGSLDQLGWHMAIEQLAQGPLAASTALAGADLHGQRETPGDGGHTVVEEGSAGFQAHRHGGSIELHQDVGWEVGAGIGEHQLLGGSGGSGQGRPWAISSRCQPLRLQQMAN